MWSPEKIPGVVARKKTLCGRPKNDNQSHVRRVGRLAHKPPLNPLYSFGTLRTVFPTGAVFYGEIRRGRCLPTKCIRNLTVVLASFGKGGGFCEAKDGGLEKNNPFHGVTVFA